MFVVPFALSEFQLIQLCFTLFFIYLYIVFVTVSLQWRLHFEFVTSKTEVPGPSTPQNAEDQIEWRAPSSLEIETMVWDLPITVLPTTPSQVAQAICMPAQQTLKL